MATPQEIQNSIELGLEWLVGEQDSNGVWSLQQNPIATTGLALLKLETYALEQGFETPFDVGYMYKNEVEKGLKYIFSQAQSDVNGIYFKDGLHYVNYATGIVLATICATSAPSQLVTSGSAAVLGKTYKEVADLIIKYLAYTQVQSGNDEGGWGYSKIDGPADNSNSGYPTLGLEFAKSPAYRFECFIPQILKDNLSNWIDYIQYDANGGSGYRTPDQYVNILKTGNLIQQMHLVGDATDSGRLQKAITYIADHWNDTIKWAQSDGGWINKSGQIPTAVDYQATFTTMKGLEGYGVDIIKTSGVLPTDIDWFAKMSDAIIFLQDDDGFWPITQGSSDTVLLCTIWALLTLEKVAPPNAYIPYENNIKVSVYEAKCPWHLLETIDVQGEIKIFAKKYSHSEAEATPGTKASKGDDVAFTLVFGNYGEFPHQAQTGIPTVEDKLFVQKPVNLKLMSLCLCDTYKLFYENTDREVKVCDKFYGLIGTYNLQLRKLVGGNYIADFDLPCHYICSISMLFQIEFAACPNCTDDLPDEELQ